MVTATPMHPVRKKRFHLDNLEPKERYKMNFYSEIEKILNERKVLTENGAVAHETTGNALLDMNFKVPSYRNASEEAILNDFLKAYAEDPDLAVKWMFYAGDIREGLGERRLFKILVKNVIPKYQHLIPKIGEYSRFDVLTELFGTSAENAMIAYVQNKLNEDYLSMKAGKPISLLAKWMPSVNTSSKETRSKAMKFIEKGQLYILKEGVVYDVMGRIVR